MGGRRDQLVLHAQSLHVKRARIRPGVWGRGECRVSRPGESCCLAAEGRGAPVRCGRDPDREALDSRRARTYGAAQRLGFEAVRCVSGARGGSARLGPPPDLVSTSFVMHRARAGLYVVTCDTTRAVSSRCVAWDLPEGDGVLRVAAPGPDSLGGKLIRVPGSWRSCPGVWTLRLLRRSRCLPPSPSAAPMSWTFSAAPSPCLTSSRSLSLCSLLVLFHSR